MGSDRDCGWIFRRLNLSVSEDEFESLRIYPTNFLSEKLRIQNGELRVFPTSMIK